MNISASDINLSLDLRDTVNEALGEELDEELDYETTLEDVIKVLCQAIVRMKRGPNG